MKRPRTRAILTANAGEIGYRPGKLTIDESCLPADIDDFQQPLFVSGLESDDIGALVRFHFVTSAFHLFNVEVGYLVVNQDNDGDGTLLPGDYVNEDPAHRSSDHLQSIVASLEAGEFEQLGLDNLSRYIVSAGLYRQSGPVFEIPNPTMRMLPKSVAVNPLVHEYPGAV